MAACWGVARGATRGGAVSLTCEGSEDDSGAGSSAASETWRLSPMDTERDILAMELAVGLM